MINHLLSSLHLGRECFGLFLPNIFKVYTVLICYMIFHRKDANTGIIWLKLQIRWNSKATQTLPELGNVGNKTLIMCFTICCCWGMEKRWIPKVALGSGGPQNTQQLQKGPQVQTRTQRTLPLLQLSVGCSEKFTPASKLKFKKAKPIATQLEPFSGVPWRSLRPDLQKNNDEAVSAVLLQSYNFHFFSQTMGSLCQTEIATNHLQFVFSKSTKKNRLLPAVM